MRNFIIILFLLFVVPSSANAFSIDSYVETSGQLTLTGVFEAKATSSPIMHDDMEGGTVDLTLSTGPKGWVDQNGGSLYTDTQAYSGSLSAYNYVERDSEGNIIGRDGFATSYIEFTNTDTVFLSYRFRISNPTVGGYGVQKGCRIAGPDATTAHYSGPGTLKIQQINPSVEYKYDVNTYDPGDGDTSIGDLILGEDEWFKIDVIHSLSTPGSADGETSITVSNGQTTINKNIMNRNGGETFTLNSVLLGLMCPNIGNDTPVGIWPAKIEMFIDDVYIDNTIARIVVCDASTTTNATVSVEQNHFSWSTSDIGFVKSIGKFSDDQDLWAIVIFSDESEVSIKIQNAPSDTGVSGATNVDGGILNFI